MAAESRGSANAKGKRNKAFAISLGSKNHTWAVPAAMKLLGKTEDSCSLRKESYDKRVDRKHIKSITLLAKFTI